jgi:hypothetical protein
MAHYLWPPQWVGSTPDWADRPGLEMRPADLAEVVFDGDAGAGVQVRAHRDGMLTFDLSSRYPRTPDRNEENPATRFEREAERQIRCVRLMNAHLACLHTVSRYPFKPTAVTPSRVIGVRLVDGRFESGRERTTGIELYMAREQLLDWTDWRIQRGVGAIGVDEIARSVELLAQLLRRPHPETTLLRAELLFRSVAAYQDHDHPTALVHAWAAAEGLLGDLLAAYLDECEERASREQPGVFINRDRRDFLLGSEMTSRHTAEILSLADRLPPALYSAVRAAAKARNNWLHKLKSVTSSDAAGAITTAQRLIGVVERVELTMPLGRQLHFPA